MYPFFSSVRGLSTPVLIGVATQLGPYTNLACVHKLGLFAFWLVGVYIELSRSWLHSMFHPFKATKGTSEKRDCTGLGCLFKVDNENSPKTSRLIGCERKVFNSPDVSSKIEHELHMDRTMMNWAQSSSRMIRLLYIFLIN